MPSRKVQFLPQAELVEILQQQETTDKHLSQMNPRVQMKFHRPQELLYPTRPLSLQLLHLLYYNLKGNQERVVNTNRP
jgi:hypothetical protein